MSYKNVEVHALNRLGVACLEPPRYELLLAKLTHALGHIVVALR